MPLLDAIITETLRLQPAVPSGQPRVTPPGGLRVDEELWLPGETVVLVPQRVVQRDERYFGRADEFVPGRWVAGGEGEEGLVREKGAWFPFQIGEFFSPLFFFSFLLTTWQGCGIVLGRSWR